MKLTPDDLQRLHTKQVANVIRKLQAGKTLTAREETILAKARAADATGETQTSEDAMPTTSAFAKTWDDLATQLGVDRKTLEHFRQRHAVRIKQLGGTLTKADGRHAIVEWRRLADELGELKGRGLNNPECDAISERELRLRERRFAVEKAEHQLKLAKGEVLPLTEYQAALGATVGAIDGALKQLPSRAAEKIIARARLAVAAALRAELTEKQFAKIAPLIENAPIDYAGVVDLLDAELKACRVALAAADFMQPDPDLA